MHQSLPYSMLAPCVKSSWKAHGTNILLHEIFNGEISQYTVHFQVMCTYTWCVLMFPSSEVYTHSLQVRCTYAHIKWGVHTLTSSEVYVRSHQVMCICTHFKQYVRERINSQMPHIGDTSLPLLKLKQLKSRATTTVSCRHLQCLCPKPCYRTCFTTSGGRMHQRSSHSIQSWSNLYMQCLYHLKWAYVTHYWSEL